MKYLVAYDISDNRTRLKVSRLLTKYGYRIQLSVFYIPHITEGELENLYREVKNMVNPKRDRVYFYPVERIEVFEGYPIEPWTVEVL
ncbi:MAG: CRISPR-associated endonuclease Cas2 [Aquificae bacterium]|nr:CRISPR-associated endonuclease Cas2 [Aquificota bacterium]